MSKTDPEGASAALSGGYGGPVAAATLVGTRKTNDAASMMAGAFMKDVVYMVVTDVQLVEKAAAGVIVRQDSQQNLKQGMGGDYNKRLPKRRSLRSIAFGWSGQPIRLIWNMRKPPPRSPRD